MSGTMAMGMEGAYAFHAFALALCFFTVMNASMAGASNTAKGASMTYIVHMDKSVMPSAFSSHSHWYTSMLSSVKTSPNNNRKDEELLVYTYDNAMHGFSAKLTESEAEAMKKMPGHIASYPDSSMMKLHSTHSFRFMGLNHRSGIWPKSQYGRDVIMGIIDTGIWPDSRSFKDDGMTEIPARWKGKCMSGIGFNSSLCNRKLIGAQYFNKGYIAENGPIDPTTEFNSARDSAGHGTHTSSTAAGNYVGNVDFFGYAKGKARGMAPRARIAMYKVVWLGKIRTSDFIAAVDQAIADGVDLISVSLSYRRGTPYSMDPVAMTSFAAMERGILVSSSAGNGGPTKSTVDNTTPWLLTVGASTTDRHFVGQVKMGNGAFAQGISYFVKNQSLSEIPLVFRSQSPTQRNCSQGSLDPKLVSGKILLCMVGSHDMATSEQLGEANRAKAAGVIIEYRAIDFDLDPSIFYTIPAILIRPEEALTVAKYATSTLKPTADMQFQITLVGSKPAPAVAYFSSRGPNTLTPGILKPDIVAPGVEILAAWRPDINLAQANSIQLQSDYALSSGTSMSCPHAAAIAALVKAVHPQWSPAAIRSALMTTAYTLDNTHHTLTDLAKTELSPATPLDFGSGHVNPNKAADPGLVYDLGVQDYVNFLCAINYTSYEIQMVTRSKKYSCSNVTGMSVSDLNYPSMVATFQKQTTPSSSKQVMAFKRIVTNVAEMASVYRAVVKAPVGVNVKVKPNVLVFNKENQKLKFSVTMQMDGPAMADETVRYGYLSWVDGNNHAVTSPLVVLFQ